MIPYKKDAKTHEIETTLGEFLKSFNESMPDGFPQASEAQLLEFRREHASFFKNGNRWSLDQHRKRIIDWLPQHLKKLERALQ